jgi:HK97 family phage major capsid protein
MLKKLREEYDNKLSFMEGLTETAVKENRDMTTNELELVTRSQDRIAALKAQIDVLAVDVSISAESQKRLDTISSAVTSPNSATGGVEYRSAGHFLQDYLRSLIGEGEQRVEASDRIKRYQRAAAHITTGEFTGVFPQALVGPVVNLINTSRPLVSALGPIGVPSGPSFRRPVLNDPNIATGVAPQVNQKDELVSKQFTITSSNVDLVTLGGYVNVSRQLLDWGVASMDTIVRQLAARYAYAVERAAVAELGESTGHEPLPADADSAATIQAIYNAAAKVYEATGSLPTILAAGPLGWARLGGLSDLGGRQIFPFMAPANAGGQMSADSLAGNPVGLRLVVTPGITDNTYWVLNDMALEVYEQVVGQLSIVEPSVLGVQVSFSGYTGMFRPAPNGAIHIAP